jgi:hypothetical protein
LTKIHNKRMSEFASELFAAVTSNTTTPHENSLPPIASTPIASPPRASTPIIHTPKDEEPILGEDDNNPPSTQFWEEASRIADMVEQSSGKTKKANDGPQTCDEALDETASAPRRGMEIEDPTFDLLPPGETWTQQFAATNQPLPQYAANNLSSDGGPPNHTLGTYYH